MAVDILDRIRDDFGVGKCPISRVRQVADEAGVSFWTLMAVARRKRNGHMVDPRHGTLEKMRSWYARQQNRSAA